MGRVRCSAWLDRTAPSLKIRPAQITRFGLTVDGQLKVWANRGRKRKYALLVRRDLDVLARFMDGTLTATPLSPRPQSAARQASVEPAAPRNAEPKRRLLRQKARARAS